MNKQFFFFFLNQGLIMVEPNFRIFSNLTMFYVKTWDYDLKLPRHNYICLCCAAVEAGASGKKKKWTDNKKL